MKRRLLIVVLVLVGGVSAAGLAAWAYFSATSTSSQLIASSTLAAPISSSASAASSTSMTVTVTTGPTSPAASGYTVRPHGSTSTTSCTIASATGSCNVTSLSVDAAFSFDIYSTLDSWISATSSTVSATTNPATPTSVTLANGGGTGNVYIDNANVSSINADVALPAASQSSDTVHLTASDGTHVVTATTQSGVTGGGTLHFLGFNLSTLNDGTVTFTTWVTNTTGGSSGSAATINTKNTVTPVTPTSVTLANGDGTGSVYINSANKGSLSYNVVEPANANNLITDTVTVSLSSTGGGGTATGTAAGKTTTGGTVSVAGINATALGDGTVTATATITNVAGNTSTSAATTNTKNTGTPPTPAGSSGKYTGNYQDNTSPTADTVTPGSGTMSFGSGFEATLALEAVETAGPNPGAVFVSAFGTTQASSITLDNASSAVSYKWAEVDQAGNLSAFVGPFAETDSH